MGGLSVGSIIRRGHTYYIKYELRRGADGQRKTKMKACPSMNKKEAQASLAAIELKIRNGEYATSNHTISSYLKEWLAYTRTSLAVSTASMYELIIHAHIVPILGNVKISELTPMHIQRFYSELQTGHSGRRKLGPKSVQNIHGLLHKSLDQAVRWSMLTYNPCDRVDLPKSIKPNISAVNIEDLKRIMDAAESAGVWRIPILISLLTGMRRGEVLALRWSDYDPAKHTIEVQRALSQYTGSISLKGTKTDRSRLIMIPEQLTAALNTLNNETVFNSPEDYICHHPDGSLLHPCRFTRIFKLMAEKLNLPITLHGLRHSHATVLINAGVSIKVVSERLGHSNISTTMDIYIHVLLEMQQKAVDVFNNM